jgi:tetratricopeptide (TPR) repeat protein
MRLRVLFFACLLAAPALAQRGGLNDPQDLQQTITTFETAPGTGVLVFSVFGERTSTRLDRQALLKLINLGSQQSFWQTTESANETGKWETSDQTQAVFTNIPFGQYDVEISAVGYLGAHKEVSVLNSLRPQQIPIVLHRDPSAINLDVIGSIMSPRARKETKHAVAALKSNNLKDAERHLVLAHQLDPASADLDFLLGYLYFQEKDFGQAGAYLTTSTTANPRNAQALTLLGRTDLERENYPAARSALEQAVLADQENWLPHNLLADAYLHEKQYEKARDESQLAIAKGKTNASASELILGQALLASGHEREGVAALNVFLEESPGHPLAGQVRSLIAQVQNDISIGDPSGSTSTGAENSATLSGVNPLDALPAPGLNLKSWRPPNIDDLNPTLAAGAVCPAEKVREESGRRVQEFVEDVTRFAAVEDLFHQALDQFGIPVRTETRKYNYVATISQPQPGFLTVDEYRAEKLTLAGYPDQIASTGFAALALVFHPDMRDNFTFTCEGLGDWHGQASWLVHFRQRDDRPNRMHSYKVGNQIKSVRLACILTPSATRSRPTDSKAAPGSPPTSSRSSESRPTWSIPCPKSSFSASINPSSMAPFPSPKRTRHSGCPNPPKSTSTSASIITIAATASITSCSSPPTPKKNARNPQLPSPQRILKSRKTRKQEVLTLRSDGPLTAWSTAVTPSASKRAHCDGWISARYNHRSCRDSRPRLSGGPEVSGRSIFGVETNADTISEARPRISASLRPASAP